MAWLLSAVLHCHSPCHGCCDTAEVGNAIGECDGAGFAGVDLVGDDFDFGGKTAVLVVIGFGAVHWVEFVAYEDGFVRWHGECWFVVGDCDGA